MPRAWRRLISAIGMSFTLENLGLIWASQAWLVPSFGTTGGASQKVFPGSAGPFIFKSIGIERQSARLLRHSAPLHHQRSCSSLSWRRILMIGLRFFVQRTTLGKAMRATAQNRDAAKMLGIDIDRVIYRHLPDRRRAGGRGRSDGRFI